MSKLKLFVLSAIIITLVIGAYLIPLTMNATSKCQSGQYTCEGECCKSNKLGCKAAPCSVIFPDIQP